MIRKVWLWIFLPFLITVFFMTGGCTSAERNIPFETIERRYSFQEVLQDPPLEKWFYEGQEPQIKVVTRADQEPGLQGAVDFDHFFVVAVFQGLKGGTNYGAEIQRIVVKDGRVLVYTRFDEPMSGGWSGEMMTSPYHSVKINREDLDVEGTVEFDLVVDEKVLATTTAILSK